MLFLFVLDQNAQQDVIHRTLMKAFGSTADFPPFLCVPFLPAIVHVLRGDFVRLQKHAPVSLTGLLMQLIVCTSQRLFLLHSARYNKTTARALITMQQSPGI